MCCEHAHLPPVPIRVLVCMWWEVAALLWMLISSGLWWCHRLWCHLRGGWTERRGGEDGQTKEIHTHNHRKCCRHEWNIGSFLIFKKTNKKMLSLFFKIKTGTRWALTIAHQDTHCRLLWQQPNQPHFINTPPHSHIPSNTVTVSPTHGPLLRLCPADYQPFSSAALHWWMEGLVWTSGKMSATAPKLCTWCPLQEMY